jgi:hypothetical protein
MDTLAISFGGGFHYGLAHGWVRVYGFNNLVTGSFQFAGGNYFGNHFGNVMAQHVRA